MSETLRRPYTREERQQLQSSLSSELSRRSGLFDAFFAFGGCLLLFLLVLGLYRGPKVLEVGAIVVSLLVGASIYVRVQRNPRRRQQADRLRAELEQGEAELSRFQVVDAIGVDEFEDEGLSFYLKLEDGRVLFLSGQYLYEPVEERSFPSTRIEVVRTPTTRQLLGLNVLGTYVPPSAQRPPFQDEEYRRGAVPEDGSLLDVDFESLRPEAE